MDILESIKNNGFFLDHPFSPSHEEQIQKLQEQGLICTLREAGVVFMNADYFWILKGNPDNVFVKNHESNGSSWLEKGTKDEVSQD